MAFLSFSWLTFDMGVFLFPCLNISVKISSSSSSSSSRLLVVVVVSKNDFNF